MHTSKKYDFEFERNIAGLLISTLNRYIWKKIENDKKKCVLHTAAIWFHRNNAITCQVGSGQTAKHNHNSFHGRN